MYLGLASKRFFGSGALASAEMIESSPRRFAFIARMRPPLSMMVHEPRSNPRVALRRKPGRKRAGMAVVVALLSGPVTHADEVSVEVSVGCDLVRHSRR